jgi:hypothetical protein
MAAETEPLKAPFPAFGGKSTVAADVWARFGDVRNFVEPFCFSATTLLRRPEPCEGTETINDLNGYVANFWRAVQHAPDAVAAWADNPVNENDLHAWHSWLVERKEWLAARLEGCREFYDAEIAGRWCWGMCCWIGSGWCSGDGPWNRVQGDDGAWRLIRSGDAGRGVHRKMVHLGNGRGVHRKMVHLGGAGQGVAAWMGTLAARLRRVRVCCGDWSRVCTPAVTVTLGLTAVFLDPPYSAETGRDMTCYGGTDDGAVSHHVRAWCLKRGSDRQLRIALCGYDGEHNELDAAGWECFAWKARGGYASQGTAAYDNCRRERIWFSPHCLRPERDRTLFD